MKIIFLILPLFLLPFLACNKAKGPVDANSIQPNNRLDTLVSFTSTVNGQPWHTDSAYAHKIIYPNDSVAFNLQVSASLTVHDTATSFLINLTNFTGPGTYTISPPVNAVSYYKGNMRYYATAGSVNIISNINYSLIGNFNFTTPDSAFVAFGTFNVAMP